MSCPPHFFLFRFCIWRGFKNKTDVCHVLCEELFILDGRPRIAKLMLKQSVVWQWCSRGRNLLDRDRDFTKNCETWSLRPRLETSKFVHFAEIFKTMSSSPLTWIFFKFLAFFRRVLVVFYLQIQQTKIFELQKFWYAISLQYSKSRDLKPSRPRPRLAKIGLKTSLETEAKSRDSTTMVWYHWFCKFINFSFNKIIFSII